MRTQCENNFSGWQTVQMTAPPATCAQPVWLHSCLVVRSAGRPALRSCRVAGPSARLQVRLYHRDEPRVLLQELLQTDGVLQQRVAAAVAGANMLESHKSSDEPD